MTALQVNMLTILEGGFWLGFFLITSGFYGRNSDSDISDIFCLFCFNKLEYDMLY
jgi:hypothetical protein